MSSISKGRYRFQVFNHLKWGQIFEVRTSEVEDKKEALRNWSSPTFLGVHDKSGIFIIREFYYLISFKFGVDILTQPQRKRGFLDWGYPPIPGAPYDYYYPYVKEIVLQELSEDEFNTRLSQEYGYTREINERDERYRDRRRSNLGRVDNVKRHLNPNEICEYSVLSDDYVVRPAGWAEYGNLNLTIGDNMKPIEGEHVDIRGNCDFHFDNNRVGKRRYSSYGFL